MANPIVPFKIAFILVLLFVFFALNSNSQQDKKTLSDSAANYGGYLDVADCRHLAGWAWDSRASTKKIKIAVFENNKEVISAIADLKRGDLLKSGKGDGRHGFDIPTPPQLKDGKVHILSLGVKGQKFRFADTKSISCQ